MKCSEIDLIGYLDGNATEEIKSHIQGCVKCIAELEKIENFIKVITTRYAQGKILEKELDDTLSSIDMTTMDELPPALKQKVAELKKNRLIERVNAAVKKSVEIVNGIVAPLSNTEIHAMPASPKDITKTKKKSKKNQ
jgi:hypothetical protein